MSEGPATISDLLLRLALHIPDGTKPEVLEAVAALASGEAVVVPKRPTAAMRREGIHATGGYVDQAVNIYEVMIAASPFAESGQ